MITVYGIKNCDTVKTALKWLDGEGIAYAFHDLRSDGVNEAMARRWIDALGWESVLNRRSATWRELPESAKTDVDGQKAANLLVQHPTLAKRPVFEVKGRVFNGFDDAVRAKLSR